MAKKSPAQLDREIAEALSKSPQRARFTKEIAAAERDGVVPVNPAGYSQLRVWLRERAEAGEMADERVDGAYETIIAYGKERRPQRQHSLKRTPSKRLKLSDNQKTMLRMAFDTGRLSSGRYGWNEMHVRALEKKGFVTLVSSHTWDKEWKLTDLGRETAKTLHAEWLEQVT